MNEKDSINIDAEKQQKRDELIFELIKRRYDSESQRTDSLDSKAGSMIGFVSIVASLLLGAATFELLSSSSNIIVLFPYLVGIALLIGSIILALYSFMIRDWVIVPNVETLLAEYTDLPYDEVLQKNAGEMAKAVVDTMHKNDKKAVFIQMSWYLLIAGLVSIFVYLPVFVFDR
jgi:hypothetical protein